MMQFMTVEARQAWRQGISGSRAVPGVLRHDVYIYTYTYICMYILYRHGLWSTLEESGVKETLDLEQSSGVLGHDVALGVAYIYIDII